MDTRVSMRYCDNMENGHTAHALVAEIRAEAAAQQLTTTTLAERAGISRPSAYRYLAGERDLPVSVLLDFARVLGVPASDLLDRAQQRARRDPQ